MSHSRGWSDVMNDSTPTSAPDPGDRARIDDLVARHHDELFAHCYRMLGSLHDADDALQDTIVRAWKGLGGFDGRSSHRTWLYRIATNVCLTALQHRTRRQMPTDFDPDDATSVDGDIAWTDPFISAQGPSSPEDVATSRESVELAFVAAYQVLPAGQRAALMLRDVLGYSARETALILDTTATAVNSSLRRARATLRDVAPEHSQHATMKRLGDTVVRSIIDDYVDAWERNDADQLVGLLAADATFAMPPRRMWFQGPDAIHRFLIEQPMQYRWRLVPARTGANLAFACYSADDHGRWVANSVDVLELHNDKIGRIVSFMYPHLVERLGLPATLPIDDHGADT
jgi:RNA polymerase sigma-70 factor (ECF subfamily)